MKIIYISMTIIILGLPTVNFAQENGTKEPAFEVNRMMPSISITNKELANAVTLEDINRHYESDWVREYIEVEIQTKYKGEIRKAFSENDTLSLEQKNHLLTADTGSQISVKANYIPENNLRQNDAKQMSFSFITEPESNARFEDGEDKLKLYLKRNAFNKIPKGGFQGYELAAVNFTVNDDGHIIEPHLFWSSGDESIDKILLETVCNMPQWKPAHYSDGTRVKQEFVFTFGNMKSCVVNMLNFYETPLNE